MIAVLAGGVGAARYLSGLVQVVDPTDITVVVNTGDDLWLHGLRICPDLDTVTYTVSGSVNPDTGWGLADETWRTRDQLARFRDSVTWFNLGDLDLATHLYRTGRLRAGEALSAITADVATGFGLGFTLLPMTDDEVETRVTVVDEGEISFQEYFVRRRHAVAVTGVRFAGIDQATPAPGVLDALGGAERVVIAPSNPIVSIGPVLAVPGVGAAVRARRDDVVAISPIVAGAALKGPADRMLAELGHEASVVGVARLYAPYASTLVIDTADARWVDEIEAAGMRAVVASTVMTDPAAAAMLARTTLEI